jgi:hypothetical protein
MRSDLLATITRLRQPAPTPPLPREAAFLCRLSLPAFWKNVGTGRLPAPVYPAPKAPRWWRSRLCAAIEATSAVPTEAKEQRRQVRLVRECAKAAAKVSPQA